MAKGINTKSGSSKVRLIVFEAEMNDGDLSQVMQAVQNALRPALPTQRVMVASSSPTASLISHDNEADEEDTIADELDSASISRPKVQRVSKPRVAKTPTVLDDIVLTSDPSLKDFVAEYDISSSVDKYLVIALWFRDARGINSITVDHVYTCFKILGWGTGSNDFAKPMRNLRDEQSFKGGARDGFSLTLPGAGKIENKKRGK